LNWRKFIAGDENCLSPHTPEFFSSYQLPYDFDPTATCPNFQRFIESSLPDDPKKWDLLQEWFGYCMTPLTHLQKFMVFIGDPGSGKSTGTRILRDLVGETLWAAPSFRDLMTPFGYQDLVGVQVATMDDARIPTNGDTSRALEFLLRVTGEDAVNVQRKYKSSLRNYKFPTKFTLTTNETPDIRDHAGALIRRLLILQFPVSFIARGEDPKLYEKMSRELPGIALWALQGLARLDKNGSFTIPDSMPAALGEWRAATAPVIEFLRATTEPCRETAIDGSTLLQGWTDWSRENKLPRVTANVFFERVEKSGLGIELVRDGSSSYVREVRGIKYRD
jgi:putative DNA primase/helicase